MVTLTVLLPVTSRGRASPAEGLASLRRLSPSLHGAELSVCLGVDEDDPLAEHVPSLECTFSCQTRVHVFPAAALAERRAQAGGAPVCWMWCELARLAFQAFAPEWTLLLGDDVILEPGDWHARLAGHVSANPQLRCIALLDTADPGFPSFLALHASHMEAFGGRLLPPAFEACNQGGDPFLFELWRSFGRAGVCAKVRVTNGIGGMEGSASGAPAAPPRYHRRGLEKAEWLALLRAGKAQLAAHLGEAPRMQIAVLVPSARVDCTSLHAIFKACCTSHTDVDIRALLQVDNPGLSPSTVGWLQQAQLGRLQALRVRVNGSNMGAAATRNALLDEACGADYVIFFDDDVMPQPGCLDAYVSAFKAFPGERAFAGSSFLPRRPTELLPTAIHLSDVTFFWEAPSTMARAWCHVPWAVTANMAAKYSFVRFREGFPKAGGGEDVDYCLLLGARLRAVPSAAVVHPWWPEGRPWVYLRFARWAEGDGRLLHLWPQHCHLRAPNPPEFCGMLLLLGMLRVLPPLVAGSMAAGALAADFISDLLANCLSPQRRRQYPCASGRLRALAAAEAWLIKAFSEGGRALGHLKRGQWRGFCRAFDWFCGIDPGVAVKETRRAAWRFCWMAAGALLAAVA